MRGQQMQLQLNANVALWRVNNTHSPYQLFKLIILYGNVVFSPFCAAPKWPKKSIHANLNSKLSPFWRIQKWKLSYWVTEKLAVPTFTSKCVLVVLASNVKHWLLSYRGAQNTRNPDRHNETDCIKGVHQWCCISIPRDWLKHIRFAEGDPLTSLIQHFDMLFLLLFIHN